MKNCSLLTKLVVCCTFGLVPNPLYAQGRSLAMQQLDAIVTPTLAQCQPQSTQLATGQVTSGQNDPAAIIPTREAQAFPMARIARTLNGIWRGQVIGDYSDLHVDYFWIMDTLRYNEGIIIALRSGNESLGDLKPVPNAPKITYLMCANEGYIPSAERGSQIHEFVKVSNSIDDASRILQNTTKLKFQFRSARLSDVRLSVLWQQLVASKYFESLPAVAFAGGLFKPIELKPIASAIGPARVSLKMNSTYYGGGSTSLKFTTGVPVVGVEYAQFVGTTTSLGDYLVASPGNGELYKVEAISGGAYDLAFDKFTIGPLQ
jgi:hypothetical protein